MTDKPEMYSEHFASAFLDASTVQAYQYRPPYSSQTFAILASLLGDAPRCVLDVGCGTGFLARPLLAWVDAVDAIDISNAMIESGQALPGGHDPRLRWIVGRVEDTPIDQLNPPYGLITAGDSVHWLDWEVALPRFATLLTPNGCFAIIGNGQVPSSWDAALQPVLSKYSIYGDLYKPINVIDELENRKLFKTIGSTRSEPILFRQTIADYIESFHGRAGCACGRMAPTAMRDFAKAARTIIAPFATSEHVELMTYATITWGKPLKA